MVERVARAIHEREISAFIWENSPQPILEHRRAQARAAIEAMREPTMEITVELATAIVGYIEDRDGPSVADLWGSLIDAALNDSAQP